MQILRIFTLFFCFFAITGLCEAAGKILFVPMDNRPVCLSYTVDTLKAAGWEIVTPPAQLIASRENMGEPDKLLDWLEQEAVTADAAVVSSDALIYGGLVASRTHNFDEQVLARRLQRVVFLKDNIPGLKLYVFSTVMRTPKASSGGVEPPYYEKYGPDIFRWSALNDKSEISSLKRKEKEEMREIKDHIPQEVLEDWLLRRNSNLNINKSLLYAAIEGKFNYFVLGKDDTAPFSQSHKEAREIEQIIAKQKPWNYRMFVGADQLGLILLTRAVNERTQDMPFVNVQYAEGKGAKTVPSYEDKEVGSTINSHIYAAGGFPTKNKKRADLSLFVNTPYDGVTKEASAPENTYDASDSIKKFVAEIGQEIENRPVALADIQFGNGASNALAMSLMQTNLGREVASYAGWNTASNSIGYALGQGILSKYMDKYDYGEHRKMLMVRYIDDWTYQANVRGMLYNEIVWPKGINGTQLDGNKAMLEEEALKRIKAFYAGHLPEKTLNSIKVSFPWNRMFEIYVEL